MSGSYCDDGIGWNGCPTYGPGLAATWYSPWHTHCNGSCHPIRLKVAPKSPLYNAKANEALSCTIRTFGEQGRDRKGEGLAKYRKVVRPNKLQAAVEWASIPLCRGRPLLTMTSDALLCFSPHLLHDLNTEYPFLLFICATKELTLRSCSYAFLLCWVRRIASCLLRLLIRPLGICSLFVRFVVRIYMWAHFFAQVTHVVSSYCTVYGVRLKPQIRSLFEAVLVQCVRYVIYAWIKNRYRLINKRPLRWWWRRKAGIAQILFFHCWVKRRQRFRVVNDR